MTGETNAKEINPKTIKMKTIFCNDDIQTYEDREEIPIIFEQIVFFVICVLGKCRRLVENLCCHVEEGGTNR